MHVLNEHLLVCYSSMPCTGCHTTGHAKQACACTYGNLPDRSLTHHLRISSSDSAACSVCKQCWFMQHTSIMPVKCVQWTLPMRQCLHCLDNEISIVCHAGICYVHWTAAECTQQASVEAAWQQCRQAACSEVQHIRASHL